MLLLSNNIKNIPDSNNTSVALSQLKVIRYLLSADVILFMIFSIIIEFVLTAHTITIIKNYILDEGVEGLICTIKNIWYFIGGSILLSLGIFCIGFGLVILLIIPLINILAIIAFIPLVFYLAGYYRFVPYYSFIQKSFDNLFYNTKRIIKWHFWSSISILLIFGIINFILSLYAKNYQTSLLNGNFDKINQKSLLITYIIIQATRFLVTYFHAIVDISFITLGIKNDRENKLSESVLDENESESDSSYYSYK